MLLRKFNAAVSLALFIFVVKCHGEGGSNAKSPITSKGAFFSIDEGEPIVSKTTSSSSSERLLQLSVAYKGSCPNSKPCGTKRRPGARVHSFPLGADGPCFPRCIYPVNKAAAKRNFICGSCPSRKTTTKAPTKAPISAIVQPTPVRPGTRSPMTGSSVGTNAPVVRTSPTSTNVPLSSQPQLAVKPTAAPATSRPSNKKTATATTSKPTAFPSIAPRTAVPSVPPTAAPIDQPTATPIDQPTGVPSDQPVAAPSVSPNQSPSALPSKAPSGIPSIAPTNQPSAVPSESVQPSSEPSDSPSKPPSSEPSSLPSGGPSAKPSQTPTGRPSASPSKRPSAMPSQTPSHRPTAKPSQAPTGRPSASPSNRPSSMPSAHPSRRPSSMPSQTPSQRPSVSHQPSTKPSQTPSQRPSVSTRPSALPSTVPSVMPSATGSVIITEVFVFENLKECQWIEIFNRNGDEVDLNGYKITWNGGSDSFTFQSGASIPSKEYRLLGFSSTGSCGVAIDFVMNGAKLLTSDTIVLKNKGEMEIDRVQYTLGTSSYQSMALKSVRYDGNAASNWCASSNRWFGPGSSSGLNGTPRRANDCGIIRQPVHPSTGPMGIIITEIMVNPIADDDSTEWFEIYNASPDPVNMTGWKIGAFMSETTHTMTSFVIGGGQYKVLGRQANIGGFTADYVYGSTKLKNSVSIALTDNAQPGSQPGSQPGPQQPQASIYYGPGSDFPDFSSSANAGKSMQLKSLTLFSGISANWCQSSTAWPDAAIGDMGTPGKANNCP